MGALDVQWKNRPKAVGLAPGEFRRRAWSIPPRDSALQNDRFRHGFRYFYRHSALFTAIPPSKMRHPKSFSPCALTSDETRARHSAPFSQKNGEFRPFSRNWDWRFYGNQSFVVVSTIPLGGVLVVRLQRRLRASGGTGSLNWCRAYDPLVCARGCRCLRLAETEPPSPDPRYLDSLPFERAECARLYARIIVRKCEICS